MSLRALEAQIPRRAHRLLIPLIISCLSIWFFVSTSGFSLNGDISSSNGLLSWRTTRTSHNDVIGFLNSTDRIPNASIIVQGETNLKLMDYDRDHIKYIYPEVIDNIYNHTDLDSVDWSRYAYVLYATSAAHLCNALMILAELRNFGTKAQLVVLARQEFLNETQHPDEYKLLTRVQREYDITIKPKEVIHKGGDDQGIWLNSYTKLLVFNETQYDRIIYMDADAILHKSHLDELFFIPPCQMAVPPAYWHMHDRFAKDEIRNRYKPEDYGFVSLTTQQRLDKISNWTDEHITPFLHTKTDYLPTVHRAKESLESDQQFLESRVNAKNFERYIYNNLPNYPATDIFKLTNIMMVIQPSAELADRVQYQLDHKGKNQYDMELVETMFDLPTMLSKQSNASLTNQPSVSFKERVNEDPEIMLIPWQRYGSISHVMNTNADHWWWGPDAHEQVFAHYRYLTPGDGEYSYYDQYDQNERPHDKVFAQMKYFHFSDAPIPKPWWRHYKSETYMESRRRCPSDPDFYKEGVKRPKWTTKHCEGAKHWEDTVKLFRETRWNVCGLELMDSKGDTYNGVIN